MYYQYKVAAILIRHVNGGTDRFTVADVEMSFKKEWHPEDPKTTERIGDIVQHAFCELGEKDDNLLISVSAKLLAETFA